MFIVLPRTLKLFFAALSIACLFLIANASNAFAETSTPPLKLALIEGLSGANANGGEAVFRNLAWAVERVNARGGVVLGPEAKQLLVLERFDSKGQTDDALTNLRLAIDSGARFILQGNVITGEDELGFAIVTWALLLLALSLVAVTLLQRRVSRWTEQ